MIYVGIDDTDMLDSPGTNHLARAVAQCVAQDFDCRLIVRHQLLVDDRVPYTSKNSSASLQFEPTDGRPLVSLIDGLRRAMRERFVEGSDPGLCVTTEVPADVEAFGRHCQKEFVTQPEARRLAAEHAIHLESLGGTEDGVIGALAAVGLARGGDDGRVVQIGTWADDLSGSQEIATLHARRVEVRCIETGVAVESGQIDVGKHLRPNYRGRRIVLFAQRASGEGGSAAEWEAVRLT